jgi:hypothetical protein
MWNLFPEFLVSFIKQLTTLLQVRLVNCYKESQWPLLEKHIGQLFSDGSNTYQDSARAENAANAAEHKKCYSISVLNG